jgi:hypothetical protein
MKILPSAFLLIVAMTSLTLFESNAQDQCKIIQSPLYACDDSLGGGSGVPIAYTCVQEIRYNTLLISTGRIING